MMNDRKESKLSLTAKAIGGLMVVSGVTLTANHFTDFKESAVSQGQFDEFKSANRLERAEVLEQMQRAYDKREEFLLRELSDIKISVQKVETKQDSMNALLYRALSAGIMPINQDEQIAGSKDGSAKTKE